MEAKDVIEWAFAGFLVCVVSFMVIGLVVLLFNLQIKKD